MRTYPQGDLIGECCGRVEMWRGGLGWACLFPALSSAGASLSGPYSASTSRSSNRTSALRASGSRRKPNDIAHEKLRVRSLSRTRPNQSLKLAGGNFLVAGHDTFCLAHSH